MKRLAGILGFAVATALLSSAASAQSRKAEERRVYSAVFDSLFHQGRESPEMVVLKDSTTWEAQNAVYKGRLQQPHRAVIGQEVIDDFSERSVPPIALSASYFSYSKPIAFVVNADAFRLDTLGKSLGRAQSANGYRFSDWTYGFAKEYPTAWGVTSVSQVGLNRAKTEALVFVGHFCGTCYHSETFYLRKKAARWRVIERIPFRWQDGLGPGQIRYLGPHAEFLPRLRKTQDSTRKALADSISRDRLPRRIHGVATNRITGLPLRGATVMLISRKYLAKDATDDRIASRTTDRRGRFEFLNPPIGPNTLVLKCPGSSVSDPAGLDMQGFFLFAATDTAVKMSAPDLRPCWLPRRIHRIQSGELEAGPRDVASANADDANVFAAVVATLYPIDSANHQNALVTQRTYQRCKRIEQCPSIRFEALVRDGTVDSSTIREFKSRSKVLWGISQSESQNAGFTLLADGERQYLDSEGPWINYGRYDASAPAGFWTAMATNYPGANAIVSFTAAGFNRARTEALVEATVETPEGSEGNETILLRRTGNAWRIEKRHVDGGVVSGRVTDGKCQVTSPNGIPSATDLSMIAGDYLFSLISDTGDGAAFDWRARFSADTTPMPKIDLNRLTAEQRELFIQRRDHRFPLFEVLDAKTGERRKYGDAGNYVESVGRMFESKSGIMQFDGDGYVLDIRAVAKDSMFGMWSAFAFGVRVGSDGFVIPEPSGHFCARRVGLAN